MLSNYVIVLNKHFSIKRSVLSHASHHLDNHFGVLCGVIQRIPGGEGSGVEHNIHGVLCLLRVLVSFVKSNQLYDDRVTRVDLEDSLVEYIRKLALNKSS